MSEIKPKSFWKKPEGVTGVIFIFTHCLGIGFITVTAMNSVLALLSTTAGLAVTL